MQPHNDIQLTIIFCLFLIVTSLSGGFLPLYIKFGEKGLHRLLALGTGMLLGTIFMHMLPEALSEHGSPLMVLVGLLALFVIERLILRAEGMNGSSHKVLGSAALLGLSVHAFTAGLGLATQLSNMTAAVLLMVSLLIHKFSESFSLSTIFILADYSRQKSIGLITFFSIFTPLGLLIGQFTLGMVPEFIIGPTIGLAAGTFLYVACCDLLPEVFHHPQGRWGSLIALLVGVSLIILILNLGYDPHAHASH